MDPFTQRMLERAKCRREKLDSQKLILEQRSPLQDKVNVNEKSGPVENNCSEKSKDKQFITSVRKSKLQKLAQFYSGDSENIILEDDEMNEEVCTTVQTERKSKCKLGRLNELACKIKEWEDDLSHPKLSASNPERKLPVIKGEVPKKPKANDTPIILDSSMVEKLCSQGFSRSESQSKLLYNFNNKKDNTSEEKSCEKDVHSEPKTNAAPKVDQKTNKLETPITNRCEVLKKAAFFESSQKESPNKSVAKDPAELSLAERKALFERNAGEVVMPKTPYIPDRKSEKVIRHENLRTPVSEPPAPKGSQLKEKRTFFEEKLFLKDNVSEEKQFPDKKEAMCPVIEKQIIPEPPPMPVSKAVKRPSDSRDDDKAEEETLSPKSGRLYPSLSNLDITNESELSTSHAESFNDSKNSNLCLNMTLSDLLELNKNNPTTPPNEQSFSQSKECQVLNKMDKLLEDALNDISSSDIEEYSEDMVPSPPKMKKSSSFEYKSGCGNSSPLLHTVSFYRKQQQNQVAAAESYEEEMEDNSETKREKQDESLLVQNKIQTLMTEVNKQQTIISQASQALNLCLSTVEFSGSGEQVEGERLLLLANHKRQACLNEVQRLRVENTLQPQGGNHFLTERGDVNLSKISIKLKRDALRSIAAAENLQYFVCLVKCDEQVLATPALSATKENLKDMALMFPGQIRLENLLSDFKITVEVYNLELGKELLPHDVKYHLVNKKEKKLLTPIKSKKSESKLVKPNIQSPAGPNAVRTTNFQLCGYIVFSLREISRTQWILNKVPFVSPVEGTISMTIQSELRLNDEFRGFLTMFDDISGFGAWHRRWCLLSSHFISYWKYPDDETKKVPIGTIDLKSVVTEKVGLVSRDICARLNTFLLETTRPRLSDDKDSLVVSVNNDITTIRHLLSADSKQEMITWCKKLNTALALLRSWKCTANE